MEQQQQQQIGAVPVHPSITVAEHLHAWNWFHCVLTEQERIMEWESHNKRVKKPRVQYSYEFFLSSMQRIHEQWVYRGSPRI